MDALYEVRFRAYGELQAFQRTLPPGSRRYEIIEHALDLALNPTRRADQFLVRNLLRDSWRVLARRAAKRREVGLDGLVEASNPETSLALRQRIASIRDLVAPISRHAMRILDGLMLGESLVETAAVCGISTDRVNQLRHAIRNTVRMMEEL